jgi:hypothetical protein
VTGSNLRCLVGVTGSNLPLKAMVVCAEVGADTAAGRVGSGLVADLAAGKRDGLGAR